jgi:hypothetical protein
MFVKHADIPKEDALILKAEEAEKIPAVKLAHQDKESKINSKS